MDFEIAGEIADIETIAVGAGVRDRARLRKQYGRGRWRKLKGVADLAPRGWRNTSGRSTLVRSTRHRQERVQVEATIPRQAASEAQAEHFAVCLDNEGYEASLEVGKLYWVIPDAEATVHGYIRVVDESGEDYAFLAGRFHPVELPQAVERALAAASRS